MSIRIMSAVWQNQNLSQTQKLVLLALADNANDEGLCWPAIATIARKCSITERSVTEQIAFLESHGFLKVDRRTGFSSKYWLTCPKQIPPITPEPGSPPPLNHVHHPPEPGSPPPLNHVHPNHQYNRQRTIKGGGSPLNAGAKAPEPWQLMKDRERIKKQLQEAKESSIPDSALIAGLAKSLKTVNESIKKL